MNEEFYNKENELIKLFDAILRKNSSTYFDVDDFLIGIDYYLDNKKINKAFKLTEMASQQHINSVDLLIRQAQILTIQKKYNEALLYLDKALQIEPSNTEIILTKAK